jgi:hypothetical protein
MYSVLTLCRKWTKSLLEHKNEERVGEESKACNGKLKYKTVQKFYELAERKTTQTQWVQIIVTYSHP